jgi:hypothetical protein
VTDYEEIDEVAFNQRTAELRAGGWMAEAAARDNYLADVAIQKLADARDRHHVIHEPPPPPVPIFPPGVEHLTVDIHAIIRMQEQADVRLAAAVEQLAVIARDIASLTEKVAELEQEFGPLARKFSGTTTRLAATRAASFVKGRK